MEQYFYYDTRAKKSLSYRNLAFEELKHNSIDAIKINRDEFKKLPNPREFTIAIEKYRIK